MFSLDILIQGLSSDTQDVHMSSSVQGLPRSVMIYNYYTISKKIKKRGGSGVGVLSKKYIKVRRERLRYKNRKNITAVSVTMLFFFLSGCHY